MEKSNGLLNLLVNVPSEIKAKLAQYTKNDEILAGKIEVVVLLGSDITTARSKIQALGATFEDLGFGFAIVIVDSNRLNELASIREIQYIELPKTLFTSYIESNRSSCVLEAWGQFGVTGNGTLVGFLDSGIDYTHPAFMDANGNTRIDYIYDLSLGGTVYNSTQINEAIKSPTPQLIVPHTDDTGHGTHVAGIACGGGKIQSTYRGVAYESSIAMVKMTAPGKVNYGKSTQLMRGLKFLLDKSKELNKPLTVNLSFSSNDGAHDGNSLLEQYINTVCNLERISMAIATGNEGDAGHHFGGELSGRQNINFNIAGEPQIIINLYRNVLDNISIEIINPQNISTGVFALKPGYINGAVGSDNYYIYITGPTPLSINGEIVISLVARGQNLIQGQWRLNVTSEDYGGREFNLWMPVSEGLAKETRFLQPNPFNTLGIPATVARCISVGSYNSDTNTLSSFSGRGDNLGTFHNPDLVAPGEAIQSAIPGGFFDALSGTSMAAPHVAGTAALMMQWGIVNGKDPFMYGERLKAFLIKGAKRNVSGEIYPNASWGYGSLCAGNAFTLTQTDIRSIDYMRREKTMSKDKDKYRRDDYEDEYEDEDYERAYEGKRRHKHSKKHKSKGKSKEKDTKNYLRETSGQPGTTAQGPTSQGNAGIQGDGTTQGASSSPSASQGPVSQTGMNPTQGPASPEIVITPSGAANQTSPQGTTATPTGPPSPPTGAAPGATNNFGNKYLNENFINYTIQYQGDIAAEINQTDYAGVVNIDGTYAVLTVRSDMERRVFRNFPDILFGKKESLVTPEALSPIDTSNISKFHSNTLLTLRGQGVIIGIIDSGIDYLNAEFQNEDDTTRIVSIWDQSISVGTTPTEYGFGTEYTREQINSAIRASKSGGNPLSIVASMDTTGHGTAMAGIAGAKGRNPELIGAAPDCEFVIVKLKDAKQTIKDDYGATHVESSVYTSTDLILAVNYLFKKVKQLNRPMVILIPMGTNRGPHDGNTILEIYIDTISRNRGIVVVTGTGNEGDSSTHTSVTLARTGDTNVIELKVDPKQKKLEFEIWSHKPDKFSVGITSPSGEFSEKIPAKLGESELVNFIFEGSSARIKYDLPEELTGDAMVIVELVNAAPGIWKITLYGDSIVDGRIDSWLPQRVLLQGDTRFLRPNELTTLTMPGTGDAIITTAYYNQTNNTLVSNSGRGYTRENRIKPDIMTGGMEVTTVGLNNLTQTVSGSSPATAVLAGAIALLFEWGIVDKKDVSMYSPKIKSYLARGARKRPGDEYPNPQQGYGILDLNGVFEAIRTLSRKENKPTLRSVEDENGIIKDEAPSSGYYIRIPKELFNRMKL